jgi:DNA-binding LacI/PurR family transcriptional regulator
MNDVSSVAPEAAHQVITRALRDRILGGDLPPGTKLPNVTQLAAQFETSTFTVQTALAPLVRDGLLERKRRVGTIVKHNAAVLTCAGIYCGRGLMGDHRFDFYRELLKQIQDQLAGCNVRTELFMDMRPTDEHTRPLPALVRAVERNEVQGLIVALGDFRCEPWLRQLPVAKSFATCNLDLNPVGPDVDQMFVLALTRLRERGCRTVGMISSVHIPADTMHPFFRMVVTYTDLVADLGLKTTAPWVFTLSDPEVSHEQHGYAAFHDLWRRPERPDGLLVYHDAAARGVMTAALELGVRVPEDIKMVFQHSTGVDWTCPLGVDWVETDVTAWAAAMIEQVRRQKAGETIEEPTLLGCRLVEGETGGRGAGVRSL